MKKSINKKAIITIAIVLIIIVSVGIIIFIQNLNDKNYEIEEVTNFSYFKLYENNKYGVIDKKGNVLVKPQYDVIEIPNPSKAVFIGYNNEDNTKTDVLNDKGQKILTQYSGVDSIIFKDTLAEIPYEKSVLKYMENGKYGIIDYKGNRITSAIYDEIESLLYKEGCLIVKKDNKYGVINIKGKQMTDIEYDLINADGFYSEKTKYKEAGFIVGKKQEDGYKYGYIDSNGNKVLDNLYNEINRITEIDNELWIIASKNGQAGVYKNKDQILKNTYEQIEYDQTSELFIIKRGGKYGVANKEGKEILKTEYDSIRIEEEIIAEKDSIIHYFDRLGNSKTNDKKEKSIPTNNKEYFITVNESEKYGIKNEAGNIILPNENSYIEYAFASYFIVTKDTGIELFDASKRETVMLGYDVIQKVDGKNAIQGIVTNDYTIELFNEKLERVAVMKEAILVTNKNYIKLYSKTERKYFDNNGNEIKNTTVFPNLSLFAYMDENGKWGFKDSNSNIVIEANYDMVTELNSYGFAGIRKDDKWGIINSNGKIVLEPTYEIESNEPDFIGEYYMQNFGYGNIYYTKDLKNN